MNTIRIVTIIIGILGIGSAALAQPRPIPKPIDPKIFEEVWKAINKTEVFTIVSAETKGANPSTTRLFIKIKNHFSSPASGTITVSRSTQECVYNYEDESYKQCVNNPPSGGQPHLCIAPCSSSSTVQLGTTTASTGTVDGNTIREVQMFIPNQSATGVITISPGLNKSFTIQIPPYIY